MFLINKTIITDKTITVGNSGISVGSPPPEGSVVVVVEEDDAVVLDTRLCNNLVLALEYSYDGIMTKDVYCEVCKLYFEEMAAFEPVRFKYYQLE